MRAAAVPRRPGPKKTEVSFENLEAGQTYKVWVRAQNEAGKGEQGGGQQQDCQSGQ